MNRRLHAVCQSNLLNLSATSSVSGIDSSMEYHRGRQEKARGQANSRPCFLPPLQEKLLFSNSTKERKQTFRAILSGMGEVLVGTENRVLVVEILGM